MDKGLPFHYILRNQHFRCGPIAPEGTFDQPTEGDPNRLHTVHVRVRESTAIFCANKASLRMRHPKSIRTEFHKLPTEAAPPPPQTEHDYMQ